MSALENMKKRCLWNQKKREENAAALLKGENEPVQSMEETGTPQFNEQFEEWSKEAPADSPYLTKEENALLKASYYSFRLQHLHPEYYGPLIIDFTQPDWKEKVAINKKILEAG